MKLAPMRYKDYVWPHNPRVYSIDYERKMAVNKVPFGTYHLQDLGRTRRVMRGEGEFAGEGAYSQFGLLANTFYDPGPGLLIHPSGRRPVPILWSCGWSRSPDRTMCVTLRFLGGQRPVQRSGAGGHPDRRGGIRRERRSAEPHGGAGGHTVGNLGPIRGGDDGAAGPKSPRSAIQT